MNFLINHTEYEILFLCKNWETKTDMAVFCNVENSKEKWILPISEINRIQEHTVTASLSKTPEHYLSIIQKYLKQHNIPENSPLESVVDMRNQGKHFSIEEHIKALVYALLSNQTKWKNVEPHLPMIDKLFSYYNPIILKQTPPENLEKIIRDLKCGNRSTKAQMASLRYNIQLFEKLEKEYGSIDAFMMSEEPYFIVQKLSHADSRYKLKMVGSALAYEYLRNVGIDAAKPDVHLTRFFSSERMGQSKNDNASVQEVLKQVNMISKETGRTKVNIDYLIWMFCSDGNVEICTKNPKCEICPIRQYCKRIS